MLTNYLLLLTLMVSLVLLKILCKVGVVDIPNQRSSHSVPVPRSGGIAIIVSWIMFLIAQHVWVTPIESNQLLVLAGLSTVIGGMGFIDDVKGLTAWLRMLVQIVSAYVITTQGFSLEKIVLPVFGEFELGIFGRALAILWIVSFTNIFNFMDGINGIAAGGALVAFSILLILLPQIDPFYYPIAAVLIATAVFFKNNFPKAKIFLGDVGSQFLGFLIAGLALYLPNSSLGGESLLLLPFVFLPFLFDTAFTLMRRAASQRNIFQAHCEHLYQLLNRAGFSHTFVALLYVIASIICGIVALYLINSPQVVSPTIYIIPFVILLGYAIFVLKYASARGVDL